MKKKYKVVMLPTSDKSPLGMHDGKLEYAPDYGFSVFDTKLNHVHNPQHLHFISEEEIKVDDYITDGYIVWQWKDDSSLLGRKKVAATSDKSLTIKNDLVIGNKGNGIIESDSNIPQIPQSFQKELCKNPVEEVYLEVEEFNYNLDELRERHLQGLPRVYQETKLKLTPNNEVIISLVEEKTYSEADIKNALHSAELKDNKNYTNIYTVMKEYLDNLK